jgi:uncharacterized membrane protein YgcG
MKRSLVLLCLLCCALPLQAQKLDDLAELKGTVTDQAEIISPAVNDKIELLAERLHKVTAVNFRVLVVRTLETPDINTYSQQLYNRWDVGGRTKGLDNGVLLLVSLLDRQVKIVAGKQVDQALNAKNREDIEWSVLAQLSKGMFAEGVELGATAISGAIIANWPKTEPAGLRINWQKASLPLFLLFVFGVAITLVVGGGFLMAFGTIVGGLFGYIFLGMFGLIMGALLGFFLFYGRNEQQELLALYEGKQAVEAMSYGKGKDGNKKK